MVEIFTKAEFESVLDKIATYKPLGIVQHNEAYLVDFGNPLAQIMVYSSVAPSGTSRDTGEDSIRAWLVTPELQPIGGKTQKYVKRTKSWRQNLERMLAEIAHLGKYIKPCPTCGQTLALAVRGDKVYAFCPVDSQNRDNKEHQRHLPLITIDKKTGEEQPKPAPIQPRTCPICQTALIKVNIRRGKDTGKQALTCPKKGENGQYLNHHFEVLPIHLPKP